MLLASYEPIEFTELTSIDEVQEFRDLYRKDWPNHAVGFYCLDNFLRWMQEHSTDLKHLHIYTLNTNWQQHGLVFIVDRYQLFVQCLRIDIEEVLVELLSQLDWSTGFKVSSVKEQLRPAVLRVIRSKELNLEYDSKTLLFYMPQIKASQLEIPSMEQFIVRPLTVADAEKIDSLWPNRHRGSLFLIRRLIAWNANMGVYTNDTNELVAWCLRLQGGFLGALQVCDNYKRLGLGTLVARATARRIAVEYGHDVMALVNPDNTPSIRMFAKLGFKENGRCYWIRNYPTKNTTEWPDGE